MAASHYGDKVILSPNSDIQPEARKINFNRYVSQLMNPTQNQVGTPDGEPKAPGKSNSQFQSQITSTQPSAKVNYQSVLNKLKKQLSHFHSANNQSNNMTQSIFGKQGDVTETMLNYRKNQKKFHDVLLNNKWRVQDATDADNDESLRERKPGESPEVVNKFWCNLPIEVTTYQQSIQKQLMEVEIK